MFMTAQPKPFGKTWSSIVQTTSTSGEKFERAGVIGLIQRGI